MDGWWEWGVVKISGSERAVDWGGQRVVWDSPLKWRSNEGSDGRRDRGG